MKEKHGYEMALLEGYRQMALDGVGEDEAHEWCEALIGDAIPDGD